MQSYPAWRRNLDELLQSGWCISIEDAGFEESHLRASWRNGEGAVKFAEDFARHGAKGENSVLIG